MKIKLPEKMKQDHSTGMITPGHARAILSLINPSDQELLYKAILDKNFSVREAEQYAGELNKGGSYR